LTSEYFYDIASALTDTKAMRSYVIKNSDLQNCSEVQLSVGDREA